MKNIDKSPLVIDTTEEFVIPPHPSPSDVWSYEFIPDKDSGWRRGTVNVKSDVHGVEYSYKRGFSMYETFHPFRQLKNGEWKEYALISAENYTLTSVMDLATGEIIAVEDDPVPGCGFCPVQFYVPDYWDDHKPPVDEKFSPGGQYWDPHSYQEYRGMFGFVQGCVWGDDNGWKIQVFDLSEISSGKIIRQDLFGYVPFAGDLKDGVDIFYDSNDYVSVALSVSLNFNGKTGHLLNYQIDGFKLKENSND